MHQSGMDRLEASLPYEAGKKFCRVVYPSDVPASSRNYVIRVQMYNDGSDKGELSGSSGIMFNVKDINTFQLVYVKYVIFCSIAFAIKSISKPGEPMDTVDVIFTGCIKNTCP